MNCSHATPRRKSSPERARVPDCPASLTLSHAVLSGVALQPANECPVVAGETLECPPDGPPPPVSPPPGTPGVQTRDFSAWWSHCLIFLLISSSGIFFSPYFPGDSLIWSSNDSQPSATTLLISKSPFSFLQCSFCIEISCCFRQVASLISPKTERMLVVAVWGFFKVSSFIFCFKYASFACLLWFLFSF